MTGQDLLSGLAVTCLFLSIGMTLAFFVLLFCGLPTLALSIGVPGECLAVGFLLGAFGTD